MKDYLIFEGETLGGKAEQLVRLAEAGFNVPEFKIIPAEAAGKIKGKEDFILGQLSKEQGFFSVRSSATGEDGMEFSFAGQFDSFLFVPKEKIIEKINAVYASAESERIKSYLAQNGIEGDVRMAVIIQEMVNAESSGVMFGIDPVTQEEDEMLVSAVYGLGEGLVSGELNADNYYIKKGKLTRVDLAEKKSKMTHDLENGSGTRMSPIDEELTNAQVLSKDQIDHLLDNLNQINKLYGIPQDVEWAIEKGEDLHPAIATDYQP